MHHPAHSEVYITHYLSWPDQFPRECPECKHSIRYAHADNGKRIHTLSGEIYQVINYYTCINPQCSKHGVYFNPATRLDFGRSYFGVDVLERISREILVFEQSPVQIHKRLTLDYNLEISLRTVQRLYKQVLLLKAHQIDETTKKCIKDQGKILLAIDGQDPQRGYPAIWLFTDILSGRLLKTTVTKSMPNGLLHSEIEDVLTSYGVDVIGFLSDKQNNLVKCMQKYYPTVPHQYCTLHFCQHLWDHVEMMDNRIFSQISKTISRLYTVSRSNDQPIEFEKHGLLSVSKVFGDINVDLQRIIKRRTKKFKSLRGLWVYRALKKYVEELESYLPGMSSGFRVEKIYKKLCVSLKRLVGDLRVQFFETLFLYDSFRLIYQRLYSEVSTRAEKQQQLDNIFGVLWAKARLLNPDLSLETVKSIHPSSANSLSVILTEWVRLWNSYLPGLFSYYDFPVTIMTNSAQEQAFSQEKGKIKRRLRVEKVGHFLQTRGEIYLRLVYATQVELEEKLISKYCGDLILSLEKDFQKKISEESRSWVQSEVDLEGISRTLKNYHPSYRKILLQKKRQEA